MKFNYLIFSVSLLLAVSGCDKKNDDLVEIPAADKFPQVIRFDDEEDGDLEDADEFSFKLTLNDRPDPEGEELGGTVVPLKQDVQVFFEIKEWEGFSGPADYILEAKAFYEIDDCTTSEDLNIDLNLVFDPATGKGSVRFPKDVPEIEVVFSTDEDYFNDNDLNDEERSLTMIITGIGGADAAVTYNAAGEFKYEILDDEAIHGDWELDHTDPTKFAAFKELFGMISADIPDLDAADVEKIEISVEFNEVKVVIELKEMESVEECGATEMVNKVIELEADIEELSTLAADGDIEWVGELEQADGSVKEYVYKGVFVISGSTLELTLVGEYDDNETNEITLILEK